MSLRVWSALVVDAGLGLGVATLALVDLPSTVLLNEPLWRDSRLGAVRAVPCRIVVCLKFVEVGVGQVSTVYIPLFVTGVALDRGLMVTNFPRAFL